MSQYCINCFHHLEPGANFCSKCGFSNAAYCQPEQALPPESILAGRYIVGKVIEQNASTLIYMAKDHLENKKVMIREYAPIYFTVRQTDGSLACRTPQDQQLFADGLTEFQNGTKTMLQSQNPAQTAIGGFKENHTAYRVMPYAQQFSGTNPSLNAFDRLNRYAGQAAANEPLSSQRDWSFPQRSGKKPVRHLIKSTVENAKTQAGARPTVKIMLIVLGVLLAVAAVVGIIALTSKKTPITMDEFTAKVNQYDDCEWMTYDVRDMKKKYPLIQDIDCAILYSSSNNCTVEFVVCANASDAKDMYDTFKNNNYTFLEEELGSQNNISEKTTGGINYKAVKITGGDHTTYIGRIDDTILLGAVSDESDESCSLMETFISECGYPLP